MAPTLIDIANGIILTTLLGAAGFCHVKLRRNPQYSPAAKDSLASLREIAMSLMVIRMYWMVDAARNWGFADVFVALAAAVAAYGATRFAYVFLEDPPVPRWGAYLIALACGTLVGVGAAII
jgi:hypothetical protein